MTTNKLVKNHKTISLFVIISMLVSMISIIGPTPAKAAGTLSVDFANDQGPVTHRASGFLHAITATQPSDSTVAALHPQAWREGYHGNADINVPNVYNRLVALGVQEVQLLISDKYLFDNPTNMSYADAAASVVNQAISNNWNKAVFDIINEPDLWYSFTSRPTEKSDNLNQML